MLNFMTPGSGIHKTFESGDARAWTRRVSQAGCLVEPGAATFQRRFHDRFQNRCLLGLRRNPCGIVDLVRPMTEATGPRS